MFARFARSVRKRPSGLFHSPPSSICPPVVRGAGAVRFGLPFGSRGVLGSRRLRYCADTLSVTNTTKNAIPARFVIPTSQFLLLTSNFLFLIPGQIAGRLLAGD